MLKPALEIVSESWHLYFKNWQHYLPYLILIFVPTLILSVLGTTSIYLEVYLPISSGASDLVITLVFAASIVLSIWASIALVRAIAATISGQAVAPWKENFSNSSHLIWPTIYTSLLSGLVVFGGLLLLIIPGIIFAVWYSFVHYAVVLDNARGMQALRASKALVVGRWWSVVWRLLVIGIAFGVLNIALLMLLGVLTSALPIATFLQSAVESLFSSLVAVVLTPFSVAGAIILYFSAKENPVTSTINPPQV